MSDACELCGQLLPEARRDAERERRIETWRQWCVENGRHITPDNRVYADVAVELLGVDAGTLKNWRYQRTGPRWFYVGKLVAYELRDLADWITSRDF